jgi:hypothetical protein
MKTRPGFIYDEQSHQWLPVQPEPQPEPAPAPIEE